MSVAHCLPAPYPAPGAGLSSSAKAVISAERNFAEVVKSFVASFPEVTRPHIRRLIACWLREWVKLADLSLRPADDTALKILELELYRHRWRRYHGTRREETNVRARENYYRRMKARDPDYRPRYRKKHAFSPRKFP